MTTFNFTIKNKPWKVKTGSWIPRVLGAAGTTIGKTTYFKRNICPDSESLAHEWYHADATNAFRYVISNTIGRLWGDKYHTNHEIGANLYGLLHKGDEDFANAAATLREKLPFYWPTVRITHKI